MQLEAIAILSPFQLIMTQKQLDSSYAGATLLNPDNKWWEVSTPKIPYGIHYAFRV